MNYFKLKPTERVSKGYILWSKNFNYQNSVISISNNYVDILKIRYKLHLNLIPFIRCLFNIPINYDKRIKFLNKVILCKEDLIKYKEYLLDTSQLNIKDFRIQEEKIINKFEQLINK